MTTYRQADGTVSVEEWLKEPGWLKNRGEEPEEVLVEWILRKEVKSGRAAPCVRLSEDLCWLVEGFKNDILYYRSYLAHYPLQQESSEESL